MERNISLKTVKTSTDKTNGNPPTRDKPLGLSQIYDYIKYKMVIRPRKDNKKKPLPFMTQS